MKRLLVPVPVLLAIGLHAAAAAGAKKPAAPAEDAFATATLRVHVVAWHDICSAQ